MQLYDVQVHVCAETKFYVDVFGTTGQNQIKRGRISWNLHKEEVI